ncbi:3-keto-disaccharide hydrolase [Sphingomonas endophytica]|uniref:3-keto-alpha-glucoside-1,2-lyase/3-keto-2-hydroxy-glucal hydratase domain-containing protein n=1 Tax=Sphingomonas endophytica TaxID=869719 RepID=A0A147I508_9SPHN|nr:DUF1080 domain-containing protein [Sphingomonas endophytica]KTT73471.1 hypothetical protein NS334_07550 [Sphingomonas endophytica]
MKKLLILSCLLLPVAADAQPHKWERIFDGRTLDGWTPKITGRAVGEDPLHTFVVKDRAIAVSYDHYAAFDGAFGHLFYKTPFKSYRLRFDYRMTGPSMSGIERWQNRNSGLMLHAQAPATMTRDQQFPVSLEFQLLAVPRPDREPSGNLCTPGTTVEFDGTRPTQHCITGTGPLVPLGKWAHVELEVLPNGTITHMIDGRRAIRYRDARLAPDDKDAQPLIAAAGGSLQLRQGYIALQSEGQPTEFRNIEVQRID